MDEAHLLPFSASLQVLVHILQFNLSLKTSVWLGIVIMAKSLVLH